MSFTCSGCPATWTAPTAAHCGHCHHSFAAVSLFDKHRSHDGDHGACLDPATVPGLEFRNGCWRGPAMDEARKAALYGTTTPTPYTPSPIPPSGHAGGRLPWGI